MAIEKENMRIRLTFARDVVGCVPCDHGGTVLRRNAAGWPVLRDSEVMGFLRRACGVLERSSGGSFPVSGRDVGGLLFVEEREIPLTFGGKPVSETVNRVVVSRPAGRPDPLRVLCEAVPAGAQAEFTLVVLDASLVPSVSVMLSCGGRGGCGFGRWRSGFTWEWIG